MQLLLAFSPFLAFLIGEQTMGTTAGLVIAALASAAVLIHSRKLRMLEVGTVLLFAALAIGAAMTPHAQWPIALVRLCVDGGLLLIVLTSIALRQPFTLQYAREHVSEQIAKTPAFLRLNTHISFVWALAFVAHMLADLVLLYRPQWPIGIAIGISAMALLAAAKFTAWYPSRRHPAKDSGDVTPDSMEGAVHVSKQR